MNPIASNARLAQEVFAALGLKSLNPGAWNADSGWSRPDSTARLESIDPTTGELLASIAPATADDYAAVIRSARREYVRWSMTPAPKRGEAIRLIADELRKYKDCLGTLIALEMGKIKAEGDGEVQEMIDIADFAVGQSRMLYGRTMHSERPQHRMYEQWHPLGLVGIISAFNFPMAVWSWNAFLAAICGNVCVWKPSAKTPLCAIAVQQLCTRVLKRHELPGIFQLFIPADNSLAETFVDDPHINLLSFTGSTHVGRHVAQRVAARLGKSLLELGGNNAIIVDEFADLELAVPSIVFGAVGTAGQRCTSTRRVIVHRSRASELATRLQSAYAQVVIGNPLQPGTLMGPLIDVDAVRAFEAAVAEARQCGGEVIYGGRTRPPGNFVEPTIIRARNEWPVVQRETFAPILYFIESDSLEVAIELHNGVAQGLSSAIFTDRLQHAERFLAAHGSDCGIANVNIGTSGAEIGGAFGGEKDTGGGRESGSDAWKHYMRRQTNTINWSPELPLAQGIDFKLAP